MNDDDMKADRQARLDKLLDSDAPRKLVVAGPGTGKTHSFRALLQRRPEPRLVITFINNLVRDLERALGDLAQVRTFHAYCRNLLHNQGGFGVTPGVDYYPGLIGLQASDQSITRGVRRRTDDVAAVFNTLDETNVILQDALTSGSYYNAVGYQDSVYRVLKYFQQRPALTPLFGQIVVDEYQDFNALEVSFIQLLATSSPVLIVGDDDQALYELKQASPAFIRELASNDAFTRFDLPYCTRCPEVIVQAVSQVVSKAQEADLLRDRVPKEFTCFIPDKRRDSERYPTITHAQCSVETTKTQYMARYIASQIRSIPEEDEAESGEKGYPVALVVGPGHFIGPIFEYLRTQLDNVVLKRSPESDEGPIDGYILLLKQETSRLGWRILCEYDRPARFDRILREALAGGDLHQLLPSDYRERHLHVVKLLKALGDQVRPTDGDIAAIERAARLPLRSVIERLGSDVDEVPEVLPEPPANEVKPSIIVTTLVGAKGLEAGHVYVAGVIDGHFPRANDDPTDVEVCEFLVAVTRARKKAHVISARNYAGGWVADGVFVEWLHGLLDRVKVTKEYLAGVEM
jgi:superfamily I DNA/RNA helicase